MRTILATRAAPVVVGTATQWGVCFKPPSSPTTDAVDLSPNLCLRESTQWGYNEPNAPVNGVHTYQWANTDANVARAEAAGLPILAQVSQPADWASSNPANSNPAPADDRYDDFAAWLTALAARYGPRISAYEIWNEPQGIGNFTTAQYIRTLTTAYPAIKAGYPLAPVVGMGANGTFVDAGQATRNAWYRTVLSDPGVKVSMDAASFHVYARGPGTDGPENGNDLGPVDTRLTNSFALLDELGYPPNFRIRVTEGGWPTVNHPAQVSEADQARFLVRQSIMLASYPRISHFYMFQLYGDGFSIIDGTRKKPAFNAYKTLCSILNGGFTIAVERLSSTPRIYKFTRTDGWGYVGWTVSGSSPVIFTGLSPEVRVTDIFGNTSIHMTAGGDLAWTVSIDPTYVEVT